MDQLITDPDRFALAAVQQYLHEHGYLGALAALEQEAGLRVRDEAPRGSQLLQLVYDHVERQLAASPADAAAVERRRLEEALLAGGSASGPGDCPSVLARSIEGLHASNIIAIAAWADRRLAVTGSSDGTVAVLRYDTGALQRTIQAAAAGVLSLAPLHGGSGGAASADADAGPSSSSATGGGADSMVVAAGCMDGSVVVLDAASGRVLARSQPHRKYVVSLCWSPDGRHLVSASWDQSFAVHRVQQAAAAGAGPAAAGSAAAGAAPAAAGGDGGWEIATVYTEQTTARVNALEFLPASAGSAGAADGGSAAGGGGGGGSGSFLVAVQGSNYLRQFSIRSSSSSSSSRDGSGGSSQNGSNSSSGGGGGGGGVMVSEGRRINMNPLGDDHVSFSAAHLALSPCGRLLLVSADNGRLIVYDVAGWGQVRSIIGLPTEQFHQYCAAWHRSGHYVMAAAAHGGLCIFHLGSARRVATLAAHSKNLRGLCYDGRHNLLLTCSFDRTVKVFEAAAAAAGGG